MKPVLTYLLLNYNVLNLHSLLRLQSPYFCVSSVSVLRLLIYLIYLNNFITSPGCFRLPKSCKYIWFSHSITDKFLFSFLLLVLFFISLSWCHLCSRLFFFSSSLSVFRLFYSCSHKMDTSSSCFILIPPSSDLSSTFQTEIYFLSLALVVYASCTMRVVTVNCL